MNEDKKKWKQEKKWNSPSVPKLIYMAKKTELTLEIEKLKQQLWEREREKRFEKVIGLSQDWNAKKKERKQR